MKKVLVVSGIPYSETNRGVDTITTYFIENNYDVEHLVFGVNRKKKIEELKKREIILKNFKQLYNLPTKLPYRILNKFPFLLKLYSLEKNFSTRKIEFEKYDLIFLETGYPLFLINKIPVTTKVILRMSDPIDFSFGINHKKFELLERMAIERSTLTLIAHKKLCNFYEQYKNIEYWRTGFDEKRIKSNKTLSKVEEELFYMGNTQVDFELLENIDRKSVV